MGGEALGAVADLAAGGHTMAEMAATTATPGVPTEAALSALARHAPGLSAEIAPLAPHRALSQPEND